MKEKFNGICQAAHAALLAPKREYVQYLLFVFGVALITLGLAQGAYADDIIGDSERFARMDAVIVLVLQLIEGRFGVLVMLCAGIGAIISSAFGQYRAALSLLVVALGAFILRTIIAVFFNTEEIEGFDDLE